MGVLRVDGFDRYGVASQPGPTTDAAPPLEDVEAAAYTTDHEVSLRSSITSFMLKEYSVGSHTRMSSKGSKGSLSILQTRAQASAPDIMFQANQGPTHQGRPQRAFRSTSTITGNSALTNTTKLSVSVSPDVLRGVPLDVSLGWCGARWGGVDEKQGLAGNNEHVDDDLYDMSKEVKRLDDFLSHDWQTKWLAKFLSLCFIYNSPAALVGSTLMGVTVMMLQRYSVLPQWLSYRFTVAGETRQVPRGAWCVLAGSATFLFFLFFWQRVRRLVLCRPRMIFVDKFCVHQNDEALKRAGIRSLAGFLNNSSRLVILWSPRYFTRLWCTYEIATWLYLGKNLNNKVLFMPVSLAHSYLSILLWSLVYYFLYTFDALGITESLWLAAIVLLWCLLWPAHQLRQLIRDLRKLQAQLANFSVRDAQCFCCQNHHRHPRTGERMVCDRLLLHETLRHWFRNESGTLSTGPGSPLAEMHLNAFDVKVRTLFAPAVASAFIELDLRYRDVLATVSPLLWYLCDFVAVTDDLSSEESMRVLAEYLTLFFLGLPLVIALVLKLAAAVDNAVGNPSHWALDALISLLITFMCMFLLGATWRVGFYARGELDHPWLQMLVAGVELAVVLRLYHYSVQRALGRLWECCYRTRRCLRRLLRGNSGSARVQPSPMRRGGTSTPTSVHSVPESTAETEETEE